MFRVTQQRVEGHSAGKRPELLTKSINALLLVIFYGLGTAFEIEKLVRKVTES